MVLDALTLDYLAGTLDEATAGGHLPDPNKTIASASEVNSANTTSYILALRSRLIDLGYLGESVERRSTTRLDEPLKSAIRRFQAEARLKQDGWAGPQTWRVLQQLVSFEDGQDPERWQGLRHHLNSPAISRAVYLRLYVLGFFDWEDKPHTRTDFNPASNARFRNALAAFLDAARRLGLTPATRDPAIDMGSLGALFGHDRLVGALAAHPGIVEDASYLQLVDAVARIELWLLGYDVNVGRPGSVFRPRRPGPHGGPRIKVTKLSLALEDFWSHQPAISRPGSGEGRRAVTPEFFARLVALEAMEETSDDLSEADLVRRVSELPQSDLDALKAKLTDIATSIWDGIRRVVRWIGRFIRHIASSALNLLKNIARFVAFRARSAFTTVKQAMGIVYRGVVYMVNRRFAGSDARHLWIEHGVDFDADQFINLEAQPAAVARIRQEYHRDSLVFGAACRILGDLLAILRRVAGLFATGVAGWFHLLLSLAWLARTLRAIGGEVRMVDAFTLRLDETSFSNPVS